MASREADPVGMTDIADRLGVKQQTVIMWKLRGVLPPHRWEVSGRPAWDWNRDIVPWAKDTGRLD